MDRLQDVDDLVGLAAIEIVDEEHDSIDRRTQLFERLGPLRRQRLLLGVERLAVRKDVAQLLEVAARQANEPELAPVVP